ncbi:hypothetical protein MA16_Dca005890 [Dendrobium catenatum]|uniref:Uncharacterized protein n=1 Tax=Dendrobium catenatum TaxID=906689 RepID=A0A2I0WXG7_9ASPA|nr:hypothetical protein MA16_Dca005890 [Dendrobium catenatum]
MYDGPVDHLSTPLVSVVQRTTVGTSTSITYINGDQSVLSIYRMQRQPDVRKWTPLGRREEMFEHIRTKLPGVLKSLFSSIIKKRTVRVPTNTGNSISTTPKSLKGVLSKSIVFDSKIQKTSPVNEKGGVNIKMPRHRIYNTDTRRQKASTIYKATPPDLQH